MILVNLMSKFRLFYFTILACIAQLLINGCSKPNYTSFRGEPLYTNKETKLSALKAAGDKYNQRDPLLLDTSTYAPNPGESYDMYQSRVKNTLTIQEYKIKSLQTAIKEKRKILADLQDELSNLQHHNTEMRLTAANLNTSDQEEQYYSRSGFTQHLIKEGDTLQTISHEYYNTYTGWLTLYRFNIKALSKGPNHLEKGDSLLIPVNL